MVHRVMLSNGQVLLIEERENSIHLGDAESNLPDETEVGSYICTIDAGGVLVMPNSGGATADLVAGLKPPQPAEDDPGYCAKSPDRKHHGACQTITPAEDRSDPEDLVADISCRYCGRSGSVRIYQQELSW